MKITTIIENMKKYHKGYGTIDEEKTRDKVLYGNVDQECKAVHDNKKRRGEHYEYKQNG